MTRSVGSFGFCDGVEYDCLEETLYVDVKAWKAGVGILDRPGTDDAGLFQVFNGFRMMHPTLGVRKIVIKGSPVVG